jgi:hypothetical protein
LDIAKLLTLLVANTFEKENKIKISKAKFLGICSLLLIIMYGTVPFYLKMLETNPRTVADLALTARAANHEDTSNKTILESKLPLGYTSRYPVLAVCRALPSCVE